MRANTAARKGDALAGSLPPTRRMVALVQREILTVDPVRREVHVAVCTGKYLRDDTTRHTTHSPNARLHAPVITHFALSATTFPFNVTRCDDSSCLDMLDEEEPPMNCRNTKGAPNGDGAGCGRESGLSEWQIYTVSTTFRTVTPPGHRRTVTRSRHRVLRVLNGCGGGDPGRVLALRGRVPRYPVMIRGQDLHSCDVTNPLQSQRSRPGSARSSYIALRASLPRFRSQRPVGRHAWG